MDIDAPSREGLPPCVRAAYFNDRVACLTTRSACDLPEHASTLPASFCVVSGIVSEVTYGTLHRQHRDWLIRGKPVFQVLVDDEAEAEKAYARAEYWVRTGELP